MNKTTATIASIAWTFASNNTRLLLVASALAGAATVVNIIGKTVDIVRILKGESIRREIYTNAHCEPEPFLLRELRQTAWKETHMSALIAGNNECQLLKMLVHLTGAKRVLEIGCFVGYSALSMAEALPADGQLITLDVSEKYTNIAQSFWERAHPHGGKIKLILGPALQTLQGLNGPFDLIFIDADKGAYMEYYQHAVALVKPGGLIVIDNVLSQDFVRSRIARFFSKSAQKMHLFNEFVTRDSRVEKVMLSIRDGVYLVRKKNV